MERLTSRDDRDACSMHARPLLSLTGTAMITYAEGGKTLLIVGPASFELREGEASVLGAPLDPGKNVVTRGKQTPVEIQSPSSFRIMLGQEGSVEELDGSTIPVSWREAANALSELVEGTTVIIGGPDTGKTTLCTFLANCLTSQHRHVAVVDADIGQTDLGPPTTMAAGDLERPVVNLSQVDPSERLFIGFTSPGRVKGKVIRCVKKLVGCHLGPEKIVIVNTDGWVTGPEAVTYKVEMLDELRPDITVGIGNAVEISEILQAGNRAGLLVSSPDTIKERSQVDRRELRTLGYQKYLAGSATKTFQIDGASVSGSLRPEALDLRRLSRRELDALIDSVVGFLDVDGFLREIGILKDVAPSTMTIKIWSRIACTASRIEVGAVKLNNEGRELSYARQE